MNLYVCEKCHLIIDQLAGTGEELFCCGEKLKSLQANTSDGIKEKHLPQCTYQNHQLHVNIGEVEHPMQEEHYIALVMVKMGGLVQRKELKPNEKPKVIFECGDYHGKVEVFEYCNLHGLWKKEILI